MKAKEYLKQLDDVRVKVQILEYDIKHLKDKAMDISSPVMGEKVKSSPKGDGFASLVANYVDIERQKLQNELNSLLEKESDIKSTIRLVSAENSEILHLRYIRGLEYDEIADLKGKSKSWATSKHGTALKELQKILNSRKNYEG